MNWSQGMPSIVWLFLKALKSSSLDLPIPALRDRDVINLSVRLWALYKKGQLPRQ